jgi:hypothetical protein
MAGKKELIMNEGQKSLKNIEFLLTFFVVIFVIYASVSAVLTARILTDVSAFNQCSKVDDEHFKACYDDKRK